MAINSPRADDYRVSSIPLDWPDEQEHRRKIAEGAELALEGKLRSTGTVTLTASDTSTTLTDARIGPQSYIGFTPTTSNAASAQTGGNPMYISARTDGSATITHANSPNADQTFVYVVIG